jgi:ABC-type enterochelin transport system substrate-binding protein
MSYYEIEVSYTDARPHQNEADPESVFVFDRTNAIYLASRYFQCCDVHAVRVTDATTGELIFSNDGDGEWFADCWDEKELLEQIMLECEHRL